MLLSNRTNQFCCQDCGSKNISSDDDSEEHQAVASLLGDYPIARLPLSYLRFLGYSGPLFALLLCLIISYTSNWKQVIRTHCDNWQFWPSISSVIGNVTPQRYIWRLGIAISLVERMHDGLVYFQIHKRWIESVKTGLSRHAQNWVQFLRWMVCIAHYIEQASLLVLTYISSSEHYDIHELSFIIFAVFSNTHMIAMTILDWELNRRREKLPRRGTPSFELLFRQKLQHHWRMFYLKLVIVVVTLSSFLMAAYLFVRHNTYCEDGVYSIFSLLEWLTVILNIAFHCLIMIEFPSWNAIIFGHHNQNSLHIS